MSDATWLLRELAAPLGRALEQMGPNLRSRVRFQITHDGVRVYSAINGDTIDDRAQRLLIEAFMGFGWGLRTELTPDLRSSVSVSFTHHQFLSRTGD